MSACFPYGFIVTVMSLCFAIMVEQIHRYRRFTMEILKCTDVEKTFGKGDNQVKALNGIDLSVEKGEFVAIVGASGSGWRCTGRRPVFPTVWRRACGSRQEIRWMPRSSLTSTRRRERTQEPWSVWGVTIWRTAVQKRILSMQCTAGKGTEWKEADGD